MPGHVLLIALWIYGQPPAYYVSPEIPRAQCKAAAKAWVAEQLAMHVVEVEHYRGAWRGRSKCVAVGIKGEWPA